MNSSSHVEFQRSSGICTNLAVGQCSNCPDATEAAFQEAIQVFKTTLTQEECKKIWLEDKNGIQDVLKVVSLAKAEYSTRKHPRTYQYLQSLASKIVQYEPVLAVAARNHLEHVSLVWGAIRFAFIGVIQHAELVKELAKALCQIADVLPQAEQKVLLYPVEEMKGLLASLNAKIIVFAQRAVLWYKESKIKHFVNAFLQPFASRFKDVIDDISGISVRIDRLALSMAMLELRETRSELQTVLQNQNLSHEVAVDTRKAVEAYHTLQYTGILDTSRRVCDIQFSMIISLAQASPLTDPETTRQFYTSRRNRRKKMKPNDYIIDPCIRTLQQWGGTPESAVTTIRGSFQTRNHIRDLAINIIDEVSLHNAPIVWALKGYEEEIELEIVSRLSKDEEISRYTTRDVLKQVVSQLLQQNHTMLNERSMALNIARFQSATTENQWFDLLGSVLEGLDAVYIVIDVGILASAAMKESVWPEAFRAVFEELRQRNVRTVVKVAFLSGGGVNHGHLLGRKGRYCVDLPKVRTGRIEKKDASRKLGRRRQLHAGIITEKPTLNEEARVL